MRRTVTAALAAVLLLMLTACTGLPTSGTVNPGFSRSDVEAPADFAFLPDGPQPGASPQQIVDGFVRAGSGPGPAGDWATARLFLTTEFADDWDPTAGVTIDRFADRSYTATTTETVALEVAPVATVDDSGVYHRAEGGEITLQFVLVREGDQWRIAQAPDGILLYQELFARVYQSASVMFFDPSWQYLVPDVRWFPNATLNFSVAQSVVDGAPSDWLASAVNTAFPEPLTVTGTVRVSDGVAQVEVGDAALRLDPISLGRMQTQLQASLASVGVPAVRMTVSGAPVEAQAAAVRTTGGSARAALIERGGEFGLLNGETVERLPGISGAVEALDATAVSVDQDRSIAGVMTAQGALVRVRSDGSSATLEASRPDVLMTIDPSGHIWSVPRSAPAELLSYAPDDTAAVPVQDAWTGAASIQSFEVSRDGSRVAAAVVVGGRTQVWVAGVERGADGAPLRLSESPLVVALSPHTVLDLTWVDDTSLGVLLRGGDQTVLLEQTVGGPGTTKVVPNDIIAAAGGSGGIRLLSSSGVLYLEQGVNWQQTATGVTLLATQQGAPR